MKAMKKDRFICDYTVYEDLAELPEMAQLLMTRAHEAARNAYAPYSHFKVGAAVLLDDGTIVLGSNIENVAYPSGLCAERVAMFAAQAQHPGVAIVALAVTAHSDKDLVAEPVSPCGSCRQVMAEVEKVSGRALTIYSQGEEGPVFQFDGVEKLLPFIFIGKYL